ncbi:MAG: type II secretion system protein [Cyanobacteriota bacterium]|nr:type II secretion system protein [Cyanobacteriota bacterium]
MNGNKNHVITSKVSDSQKVKEILNQVQNDNYKRVAFTLAEVLITLGVIGVVAALTMPTLITNYKAKKLRTQFLKSYSTIQQAAKLMQSEDIAIDPSQFGYGKFSKTFGNFLQAPLDCTNKTTIPCYPYKKAGNNRYKSLNGESVVGFFYNDAGQFVMQDGTLILFDTPDYWDENGIKIHTNVIAVDINGYKNPPNRWGYDVFAFEFIDGEIVTAGDKKTHWADLEKYCSDSSTDRNNGFACAQKAKNDTDYFKKLVKEFK